MNRHFWVGLVSGVALSIFVAFSGIFIMMAGIGDHGPSNHMMSTTPSSGIFASAMDKMHGDMQMPSTGNTDVDFMRGMIPHHQGALEMAEIVLQKGTDPEVKALANKVIAAQKAEIAEMQEWLKRKGF